MLRCRSVHHTYVGRSLFFLCPLSAPLLFKQVLRSMSLAGLPFRLGLGRVMDAIGYSSGLLAPFTSYPYLDVVSFSRWFGSLYCISVFLTHGVIVVYICSVGSIVDYCVMTFLRFPPALKCLVGTFESFLCGFGGNRWNLHRVDSEGVTEWYQSSAVAIPHKSSL